jgi:P-type Mg2+ transporter
MRHRAGLMRINRTAATLTTFGGRNEPNRAMSHCAMHSALTHRFTRFLHHRRALKHFGRHPLLDAIAGRGPHGPASDLLARDLLRVARDRPAAAITRLKSHEGGLSTREAAARLAHSGPNEIAHEKPLPWWLHLWRCDKNPFNLLLTVLAALSYASADVKATAVIGVMVALSTLLRFVQEGRSHRAAERLKALVSNTASVIRRDAGNKTHGDAGPPRQREIAIRQLVPGDLVVLSAGDMIPADCRVLAARDLFVAQAAMTGESAPVEKFAEWRDGAAGPLEQRNLVFMGTSVVSGSATVLVVSLRWLNAN